MRTKKRETKELENKPPELSKALLKIIDEVEHNKNRSEIVSLAKNDKN